MKVGICSDDGFRMMCERYAGDQDIECVHPVPRSCHPVPGFLRAVPFASEHTDGFYAMDCDIRSPQTRNQPGPDIAPCIQRDGGDSRYVSKRLG